MNINDLISKLAGSAGRSGMNTEVVIVTGNLVHVDWKFEHTGKTLQLKLDMEGFAEAEAEGKEAEDTEDTGWGELDREVPSWKDPHRADI